MSLDLSFLHCNHDPHCTATVDKHFEGYYSLQLGTKGGVELFYEEARRDLNCDNGFWFWPAFPGPRIRFHAVPEVGWWEHRYAAFRGPRVSEWRAQGWWPDVPQPAEGEEWPQRMDELLSHAHRTDRWSVARAANLLEGILVDLNELRAGSHGRERPAWLSKLMHELDESSAFSPDYTRLSREAGMGLSTLRRRFREETGQSLHAYVLQTRMTRARRMLGETDRPLKAVADALGYGDVAFFAAQFKSSIGVTPGEYRKSRQM